MNVPTTTAELDAIVFGAGTTRETALSIPAVARARDLICGAISTMPLRTFRVQFDASGVQVGEDPTPPWSWIFRPDPFHSRAWLLSATADDLLFHGFGLWRVRSRYQTGFPSSFQYLPWSYVYLQTDIATGQILEVAFAGEEIDLNDIVLFESPLAPVLAYGARAINTTLKIEAAADRFADVETPSGYLQQTDGSDPMDADELLDMASAWTANRKSRATAALNNAVKWVESSYDPEKLELLNARLHQSTEMARIMNVPAALIQAPTNLRMTYSNIEMMKQDLFDLGIFPIVTAIEQALSANNVTPRWYIVRTDPTVFLRNPWIAQPPGGTGVGTVPQAPGDPPAQPDQGGSP
jgi:hypothetical protein